MNDIPPSYEAAVQRDYWIIIAEYLHSSDDLCAASRVCKRWHQIYSPLLWGNPASHFGTENDRVYGQPPSSLLLHQAYIGQWPLHASDEV